jgi:hypothetical protein
MSSLLKKIAEAKREVLKTVQSIYDSGIIDRIPYDYVSRAGVTKKDLIEKIIGMENCSSILEYKLFSDGQEKVLHSNNCKGNIYCKNCAQRLQATRRGKLLPKIKKMSRTYKNVYSIVFTIPDDPDLRGSLDFLQESLKKFRLMGQKRSDGYSSGEWSKIRAGVLKIEIKKGEGSGLWHSHAHGLFFTDDILDFSVYDSEKKKELEKEYGAGKVPKGILETAAKGNYYFIDEETGQKKLCSKITHEWYEASGGKAKNLDCKKLKKIPDNCSPADFKKYSDMSYFESVTEQAKEILKYDFKYSQDLTPADIVEVITDTPGHRFMATFGAMRTIDYDSIIRHLIDWNNKPELHNENYANWILNNTDLYQIIGNRERVEKVLAGFVGKVKQDEIEDIMQYFKFGDYEIGDFDMPDLNTGDPQIWQWNKKASDYENTSENTRSKRPPFLSKQINEVTGEYRKYRNALLKIRETVLDIAEKLDNAKSVMRQKVSDILNGYYDKAGCNRHHETAGESLGHWTIKTAAAAFSRGWGADPAAVQINAAVSPSF